MNDYDLNNYIYMASDVEDAKWQKDTRSFYYKLLREGQQKRLMESKLTKLMKNKCKISNDKEKSFTCPCCKNNFKNLQSAHIGPTISTVIYNILDKYKDNLDSKNFIELFNEVIEEEKKYVIIPVCQKCNKTFETK